MNMFRDWELASAEKSWNNDMYFDEENIPRWKSNNSVPMNDMLDMWKFLNKKFDYDKTVEARQREKMRKHSDNIALLERSTAILVKSLPKFKLNLEMKKLLIS